MCLVFIGVVRRVLRPFRSLVLLKAVLTLLDARLFHGELQELVVDGIEADGQVVRITLQREVDALMLPGMLRRLADKDHGDTPTVLLKDTPDQVGIALAGAARLPDKGGVIIDRALMVELRGIVVTDILHQLLQLARRLDIEAVQNLHRMAVLLRHDGTVDGRIGVKGKVKGTRKVNIIVTETVGGRRLKGLPVPRQIIYRPAV